VTDDDGATDSHAENAPVDVSLPMVWVFDIAMLGKQAGPNLSATAVIAIHDAENQPVVGATVHGRWSGDFSEEVSALTGAEGTVSFNSAKVRADSATFTFAVTDVYKSGHTYDPSLNTETAETIIVP